MKENRLPLASFLMQEEEVPYLFRVLSLLHVVELVVLDLPVPGQRRLPADGDRGGGSRVRADVGGRTGELN